MSTAVRSNVGEEPPRVFHDETSRCGCGDQLAHEDMCVHEIVAHGGYRREMFLPRHLARHCVTGSTTGCPHPSETEGIDDILGYEEEVVPDFFGTNEGVGGDDDMIGAVDMNAVPLSGGNVVSTLPQPQVPAAKPGQLPSKSLGKVQPLRKQTLTNILTSAADSYTSMSEDNKYAISNLALQMRELLTVTQDSTTVKNRSGISVAVPSNACIIAQPKNRLVPLREAVAKKRKTSSQSSTPLARTTHELAMNPTTRRIKCSFCMCDHMITSCSRKQQFRSNTIEYELSTDYPAQEQNLRNRLQQMPVTEGGGKGSPPFQSIAKDYLSRNFIIHGARSMEDNSRIWCVSFIGKDGQVMISSLTEKIWIGATAMNQLVTHTKKVKKYVYDETITLQTHALN